MRAAKITVDIANGEQHCRVMRGRDASLFIGGSVLKLA